MSVRQPAVPIAVHPAPLRSEAVPPPRFRPFAERRTPVVNAYDVPVTGLDPAHDGVRIAHLTDIHVGLLTPPSRIRAAVDRANEARADLVVLTGDYLCYSPRNVGRLQAQIAGLRGTVVCVLGNHDYWTDGEGVAGALTANGYRVLRNENVQLTVRGRPMDVIGIDDAITRHHDVDRAFAGIARGRGAPSRVVLSHAPSLVRHVAARGGGLVLAGHTHGGQVHLPRVSDRMWAAVGHPFLKGFYRVGDATLFVNNGVGASSVPLRAGAPSEVAVLTLRAI